MGHIAEESRHGGEESRHNNKLGHLAKESRHSGEELRHNEESGHIAKDSRHNKEKSRHKTHWDTLPRNGDTVWTYRNITTNLHILPINRDRPKTDRDIEKRKWNT